MRVPKDQDHEGLSFNDLQRRAAKADSGEQGSSPLSGLGLDDLSKLDFDKLMEEALEVRGVVYTTHKHWSHYSY